MQNWPTSIDYGDGKCLDAAQLATIERKHRECMLVTRSLFANEQTIVGALLHFAATRNPSPGNGDLTRSLFAKQTLFTTSLITIHGLDKLFRSKTKNLVTECHRILSISMEVSTLAKFSLSMYPNQNTVTTYCTLVTFHPMLFLLSLQLFIH